MLVTNRPTHAPATTPVDAALAALAAGRTVILVDPAVPDHAGYLVAAADLVTVPQVAFLVRHSSGVLCVPMPAADADRLRLPLMVRHNENRDGAAFTVSVDAVQGTSTGISAADRAATIRRLADPVATADDFSRPGHVFPLRARPGGVLERPRYTEAAVDLVTLAGAGRVAVLAALVNDDSDAVTDDDITRFAGRHHIPVLTVPDFVRHRQQT